MIIIWSLSSHSFIVNLKYSASYAATKARWLTTKMYCSSCGAMTVISTPAAFMCSSPNCAANSHATLV